MKTDVNGTSTCQPGEERYEFYRSATGKRMVQYDYRFPDGELFSCAVRYLEEARIRRNQRSMQKQEEEQARAEARR